MTFLKLVLHAGAAGLYGGAVIALLLSLMNPATPSDGPGSTIPALALAALLYAVAAAFLWPCLYGGLRYFASHRLSLPWFSPRYALAFHAVNTGAILVSGWYTLSRARNALSPSSAAATGTALTLLTVGWAAATAVASSRLSRRPAFQAASGAAALAVLLAASMTDAGAAEPARRGGSLAAPARAPLRRLIWLNLDGADLDFILPLEAQGKLPAFSRLIQEGAYGRLRSIVPCAAGVVRATLVTGKLPFRHGVRSDRSRRLGGGKPWSDVPGPWIDVVPAGLGFDLLLAPLLETRSPAVADRRGLALWEVARLAGGSGAGIGWDVDLDRGDAAGAARSGREEHPGWLDEWVDPEALRQSAPSLRAPIPDLVAAVRADDAVAVELDAAVSGTTAVVAASLPGLDRVAHAFYRSARPRDFGNVPEKEIELYGTILERYYRRVDGIVGRILDRTGRDGTTLLVTSGHGMRPVPLRERLGRGGGTIRSGTHEDAPDGILFARGPDCSAGRVIGKGSIGDVVPTALYALGLPVARDLDGSILAGVFTAAYTFDHPVSVIDTYEAAAHRPD